MSAQPAALSRPLRWALALAAGVLMRLAFGLQPLWWLALLAPVPLLLAARAASAREAFAMALAAALIGPVLPWHYLASLMPWPVATAIVLAMALMWGVVVVVTHVVQRRGAAWAAPLAFGLALAAADALLAAASPDGTASSLAYTQADALALVQLAALGGTPAIVFVIGLVAAIVADGVQALRQRSAGSAAAPLAAACLLLIAAWGFGIWRLVPADTGPTLPVAAVAIDKGLVDRRSAPDAFDRLLADYQAALARAVRSEPRPRLVLLPERIADVQAGEVDAVARQLGAVARAVGADLVVGLGVFGVEGRNHNEAWWIAADGTLAARYRKQHLVQGLEARFTPGTGAPTEVARELQGRVLALVICKDMDFPATIGRTLRATQATALLVPAWDFGNDGWLHSRMAVLRGVEQGVALLRSAREGRVTLSDAYGRVQTEAVSSAQGALLTAALPLQRQPTVYAAIGPMVQWAWPLALALLLAHAAARSRTAASGPRSFGSAA